MGRQDAAVAADQTEFVALDLTIATVSPAWVIDSAATAMLLKRQKPIARETSAWWPGGRTARKAASPSPRRNASTAAIPAPADRSAASQEASEAKVSGSSPPPPAAQKSLIERT